MIYNHLDTEPRPDPEKWFMVIGMIIVLLVLIIITLLTDEGWILGIDFFLMAVVFFGLVGKIKN